MSSDPAKPEEHNVVPLIKAFENPDKRIGGRHSAKSVDLGGGGSTSTASTGEDGLGDLRAVGRNVMMYFYLSTAHQLLRLKAAEHGRLHIDAAYGDKIYQIAQLFPHFGKGGEVDGGDYGKASRMMMTAAASKGIFDEAGRTRGSGAYTDAEGRLVLNCGNAILIEGEWCSPGIYGKFVYTADKATPRPWSKKVAGGDRGPAQALLAELKTWKWKRPDLDPLLLLGWIGSAMLAGALSWRPVVWITGGRGTGKSTLHHLLSALFDEALISVSDATAAGIWQKLQYSTLPVTIDELEAEEDGRKVQAVVKLIRQAASGGLVLRGGSDHGASEFVAKSCFLASSILMPSLQPQDKSRMAVLELGDLEGGPAPQIDPKKYRELGQKLFRRVVDGWPRLNETLEMYRSALMDVGHSARGADVFGTLLALADLMLLDGELNHDAVAGIVKQLDVKSLAEVEDDAREEDRCLQHLLTQMLPLQGTGPRRSVAELIMRASGMLPSEEDETGGVTRHTIDEAQRMLGQHGMKVVQEGEDRVFAIASYHAELAKLFAGTHWQGRAGGVGVWTQALRRLTGARAAGKNVWFSGTGIKATFIRLVNVLSDPDPGDIRTPSDPRFRLEGER